MKLLESTRGIGRHLSSGGTWYSAGFVFRNAGFYLLLPIFAALMEPSEVGHFFYFLTFANLGGVVFAGGMNNYVTRCAYSSTKLKFVTAQSAIFVIGVASTLATTLSVWSPAAATVAAVAGLKSLARLSEAKLLGLNLTTHLGQLYLASGFTVVAVGWLVVLYRPTGVSALWSIGAGEAVVATALVAGVGLRPVLRSLRIRPSALRRGMAYGFPLVAASFFNLLLGSLDRIWIDLFLGPTALAGFGMMYTLAFLGHRFITTPANAWLLPRYIRLKVKGDDVSYIGRIGLGIAVLLSAWAAVATLGGSTLLAFLGREYQLDRLNYALVSGAAVLFLWYTLNTMALKVRNRTSAIMWQVAAALAVNVGLSVLLIPKIGILGASASTFCSYLVLTVAVGIVERDLVVPKRVGLGLAVFLSMLLTVAWGI